MIQQSKGRRLMILVGIIVLFVLVSWVTYKYFGRPMIEIFTNPAQTKLWVEEHGAWSRLIFIFACALQVVIAVLPGGPLEVGAGFAFGKVEGTILSMAGLTLGSFLVFVLVKKYGMKFVGLFFSEEKVRSLRIFRNPKKLKILAFILFLIPGSPKDYLTYMGGMTPISAGSWMLLTSIARLPSVIISVMGGAALYGKKYMFIIILAVAGALFSVIGYKVFKKLNRLPMARLAKKPSGERLFKKVSPDRLKLQRLPSKGRFSKLFCPMKIKP